MFEVKRVEVIIGKLTVVATETPNPKQRQRQQQRWISHGLRIIRYERVWQSCSGQISILVRAFLLSATVQTGNWFLVSFLNKSYTFWMSQSWIEISKLFCMWTAEYSGGQRQSQSLSWSHILDVYSFIHSDCHIKPACLLTKSRSGKFTSLQQ